MKSNYEREALCESRFWEAGECWHLWTDEDHPVIFASPDDFAAGMTVFGITAAMFQDIRLYTFELMSNHIHAVASGREKRLREFFGMFRKLLGNYLSGGRYSRDGHTAYADLSRFCCRLRKIENLSDLRAVIAYNNRNGYLVSPDETPFSYPWGANKYYFNRDIKSIAASCNKFLTIREKLDIIHTHATDNIAPLRKVFGCACPLDFCHIEEGEQFFQSASQYFHIISRNIESFAKIAGEISERIFYTDDELFSAIASQTKSRYGKRIADLDKNEKTELARMMHYDFNAGNKQISRILKLPLAVLDSFFPPRP